MSLILRRALPSAARTLARTQHQTRGLITLEKPLYTTRATATGGGRDGNSALDDGSMQVTLALPHELGGDGKGHNPEQLLAIGYGACFLGALRAVAGQKKVTVPKGTTVQTAVTIGNPKGLPGFGLRVEILVKGLEGVADKEALVQAAHEFCPYSRAFTQGIEVSAKPA